MLEVSDRLDLAGETQAICNIGVMRTSHFSLLSSGSARDRLSQIFGLKLLEPQGEEISQNTGLGGVCQIINREARPGQGGDIGFIGILIGANLGLIISNINAIAPCHWPIDLVVYSFFGEDCCGDVLGMILFLQYFFTFKGFRGTF